MTSYSDVIIHVLDVNDEPPRFPPTTIYRFDVTENQPAGTEVGSVSATDNDNEPFNKFIYALVPKQLNVDEVEPFNIESGTGRISTTRQLDREQQTEHRVVVIATDVMKSELSSTTTVTIYVRDVNDNLPAFVFPSVVDSTIKLMTWQVNIQVNVP